MCQSAVAAVGVFAIGLMTATVLPVAPAHSETIKAGTGIESALAASTQSVVSVLPLRGNAARQTRQAPRGQQGVRAPRVQPQFGTPGPLLPAPIQRQRQQQRSNRPDAPEGSGVVTGDGTLVVTAAHVLRGARGVHVRTRDGQVLAGRVAGVDRATDIALIRLEEKLVPVKMRDTTLRLGETACAYGNAFGLDLTLTCGVVSAVNKSGTGFNPIEDFVQTDAPVNPGMSGGALFDRSGRMIGLLSAIFTKTSDANIGVNFAVSVPLLKRVVGDLTKFGRVKRIASGLIVRNGLRRGAVGRMGARVFRVRPGTAAAASGFQPGDLITSVASGTHSRRIRTPSDFVSFTAILPYPYSANVLIYRNGKPQTLVLAVSP